MRGEKHPAAFKQAQYRKKKNRAVDRAFPFVYIIVRDVFRPLALT